jgi:phage gpG-like protein
MNDDTIQLNTKNLDLFIKLLKKNSSALKIGILGSSARAPTHGGTKAPTNAVVGAVHEFGSPARGIPQRSFLRIPLSENLGKELENSDLFNENKLKEVVQTKNMGPWLEVVGVIGLGIVDDAFETEGQGKWAPWKNPHYTNQGGSILTDSGQLRNSVTSKVET